MRKAYDRILDAIPLFIFLYSFAVLTFFQNWFVGLLMTGFATFAVVLLVGHSFELEEMWGK